MDSFDDFLKGQLDNRQIYKKDLKAIEQDLENHKAAFKKLNTLLKEMIRRIEALERESREREEKHC